MKKILGIVLSLFVVFSLNAQHYDTVKNNFKKTFNINQYFHSLSGNKNDTIKAIKNHTFDITIEYLYYKHINQNICKITFSYDNIKYRYEFDNVEFTIFYDTYNVPWYHFIDKHGNYLFMLTLTDPFGKRYRYAERYNIFDKTYYSFVYNSGLEKYFNIKKILNEK